MACHQARRETARAPGQRKAPEVPVDRLPVLLIANSQNIQATSLSGTSSSSLYTSTKQTTAMDFLYQEETVCWIHVGDTSAGTHLKCAKIMGLKSFTDERTINISLSLHRRIPSTDIYRLFPASAMMPMLGIPS
ncbi:hypothetical protein NFI96_001325 [Prochilodus magdalenae]|nr:hypothetical protein NFI96_001325 [Prochilodus magdalenae]